MSFNALCENTGNLFGVGTESALLLGQTAIDDAE
jgi:hypothetical protein